MAKSPTVDDVARLAGVSRQTVSNVLSKPEIVREATRDRVRDAISTLGYRPQLAARRLRTQRSSTIGIQIRADEGGIGGVVLDRFVHALAGQAVQRGMRVQVYTASSPTEELTRIADLLDGGEIDAVVISSTFYGDPRAQWLREREVPFVSFGRPWGEASLYDDSQLWVDVDGAAGTRAATEHAIAAGARNIAFLGWPPGSGTGDDREAGWQAAITDASLPALRLVATDDVGRARSVLEAAFTVHDIDAVVCASDTLALGAHLASVTHGKPLLPVYGFDNTPTAAALGLPSVEQRPERVAQGALDLLMGPEGRTVAPIKQPGEPAHVLVTPTLVVREFTT